MESAEGGGQRRDSGGEVDTKLKRSIGPRVHTVFVIGDILGAGTYALVGEVGAEVGGAIWTAFLVSFVLAFFSAFAYAELVTKYPQAAGAALYAHKAFRMPFFTFIVAFAVMSSGIASAATLSRAFAGDYLSEFVDLPLVLAAIAFILLLAAINLRGIAESTNLNVVLTAAIAIVLITTGDLSSLADTTVLLLLFVFTIVNIAVLALRRDSVDHQHFHAPSVFPVLLTTSVRSRAPGCCWSSERCYGGSTGSSKARTRGSRRRGSPAR